MFTRSLFASTLFLSAFLLFTAQPLVGRLMLPQLGGAAAVWTTCLVFFQALLLAGYAWAHVLAQAPGRWTMAGHLTGIGIAVAFLPLGLRGWAVPPGPDPTVWLLAYLTASVGVPLFVLSTNAPLLQRWFADASTSGEGHPDPYVLYAASNAGSLGGLLAYPLLVERYWALTTQRLFWSWGFAALVCMVAACGAVAWQQRPRRPTENETTTEPSPISWRRAAGWLVLALVPSSLVVGSTAYLSSELVPMPLLWVVPLAIYLGTFITSFGGYRVTLNSALVRAYPLVAVPLAAWMLSGAAPLWSTVFLHVATLWVAASLCHGRLAEDRPPPRYLTSFYLWLATGGVIGGLINAVLAPLVFTTVAEYPLMLLAAAAIVWRLRERRQPFGTWDRRVAFAGLAGAAVWLVLAPAPNATAAIVLLASFIAAGMIQRPLIRGVVVVVTLFLVVKLVADNPFEGVRTARSFYASVRVVDHWRPDVRALIHGSTVHGLQTMDGRLEPLTYFARRGPIGQVIRLWSDSLAGSAVGVVGLGAGELAAYAQPRQRWTFFEIDPMVERLARNSALFTYVSDAEGQICVIIGDGRVSLKASTDRFGLLVLDAFSSDAVPTHLLTREALALYQTRLRRDGGLAFHISNRFADLRPVLGALAADAGLLAVARFDAGEDADGADLGRFPSLWVVLSGREGPAPLLLEHGWTKLDGARPQWLWTDERIDLVSVLNWSALGAIR